MTTLELYCKCKSSDQFSKQKSGILLQISAILLRILRDFRRCPEIARICSVEQIRPMTEHQTAVTGHCRICVHFPMPRRGPLACSFRPPRDNFCCKHGIATGRGQEVDRHPGGQGRQTHRTQPPGWPAEEGGARSFQGVGSACSKKTRADVAQAAILPPVRTGLAFRLQ